MFESIFDKHNVRNVVIPLLLVILPLIIISVITINRFEYSVESQTISSMQNSIEERLIVLKNSFEYAERECHEIAQNPLVLDLISRSNHYAENPLTAKPMNDLERDIAELRLRSYLGRIIEDSSLYENIFFLNRYGQFIMDAKRGAYHGIDFSKMSFYSAVQRGNLYIQDVEESPLSGKPIMIIATPVFDNENRIIGVAGTAIEFDKVAAKVVRKSSNSSFDYGIVNNKGLLIAHTRPELIFKVDLTIANESLMAAFEKMKLYKPDYSFYDFEGEKKVAAFTAFREKNWHIFCSTRVDDYMQPIKTIELIVSAILLACIAIAYLVILKTAQLKTSNTELKTTLVELQQTQAQLILSEKMAALGGLVAGVAHEINTPIGVGVTASSHLKQKTERLKELFTSDQMKRSDLEKYIETSSEASGIIFSNLQRASSLIQSFKQIAADQAIDEKREFVLKEYIDEIILNLRPVLKKTEHKLTISCDESLKVHSYPGSFSHILNNLIMNSIKHAYNEGEKGNLNLDVKKQGGLVVLRYTDDGKGMEPEVLDKIFDPFFTTKRGKGGTGLGMNIVYNIVTKELGGTIKCKSQPGSGTELTIIFPVESKDDTEL